MNEQLNTQIIETLARLENGIKEVKTEITDLKLEMESVKTEINSVKTEMEGVKTEINSVKTEIGIVKTEVKGINTRLDQIEKNTALIPLLQSAIMEVSGEIMATKETVEVHEEKFSRLRLI